MIFIHCLATAHSILIQFTENCYHINYPLFIPISYIWINGSMNDWIDGRDRWMNQMINYVFCFCIQMLHFIQSVDQSWKNLIALRFCDITQLISNFRRWINVFVFSFMEISLTIRHWLQSKSIDKNAFAYKSTKWNLFNKNSYSYDDGIEYFCEWGSWLMVHG